MSVPTLDPIAPAYSSGESEQDRAFLGVVGFDAPGDLSIAMPPLGREGVRELWAARRAPERTSDRGFVLSTDGDLLFGATSAADARPLEELARDVYSRAIAAAREAGYPYFIRMWNHVGGINVVDDGCESYQRFCVGRHAAFESAGYQLAGDLPAASAVGMDGRGLATYFLAAREPGVQVENPRQVAAYRYPRQYGPKSPSFSRATIYGETVFVSGTASVVGHQTMHVGDVEAQLEETLRNIDVVLGRAIRGGGLQNVVAMKTYVRNAADYDLIASRLAESIPPETQRIFLRSDICRADLLLEIEAIAR